jgi:hypothetical protein
MRTIKETTLRNRISLVIISSLLFLTCRDKNCSNGHSHETLLQQYTTPKATFTLWNVEQGAFGSIVKLRICDTKINKLSEEIALRGEEYLPYLDSVAGNTLYIHYTMPRRQESSIEILEFKSVVLGDAFLDSTSPNYKYVFSNMEPL